MSDRLVKQQLRGYITIWNRALYVNNTNIFRIPEDQPLEQTGHFYELVNFYFTRPRKRFRQEVIGSLLRCFLLDICELMEEQTAVETSSVHSQGDQLFNRFLQILSESQGQAPDGGVIRRPALCLAEIPFRRMQENQRQDRNAMDQ